METRAPGFTGDWLNAWLAALGVVVLCPDVQLSWTEDPRPVAAFDHDESSSLVDRLAQVFPTQREVEVLAISRTLDQLDSEFPRKPTLQQYLLRCDFARMRGDGTLMASITDLAASKDEVLAHSPLDPGAPKGTTLGDRWKDSRASIADVEEGLSNSLTGSARRIKGNGLGFDHRRYLSASDPKGDVWVDPVIEVLAGIGMLLVPARGDGRRLAVRGWTGHSLRPGAFRWPVWREPLDVAAVDSLLDRYWAEMEVDVHAFESIPYRPRGSMDQTRGYASRRVR